MELTNEELALRIKAGETDLIPQLWEKVEKFIEWKAKSYYFRWINKSEIDPRCEIDDLTQSGYFSMISAVRYYREDLDCKFLTVLANCLKTGFSDTVGIRGSKRDALLFAGSIDAALGETEDFTLLGTLKCTLAANSDDTEDAATIQVYQQQLHDALEHAMQMLPEQQDAILHKLFYENQTSKIIAHELGCTRTNVTMQKNSALRKLYDARKTNGLSEFVEENTNYYKKVGIKQFKNTRTSAVEAIVMERDRLTKKWLREHGLIGGE